jgi:hypothetical protein
MMLWFDKETNQIILTSSDHNAKVSLDIEEAKELQEELDRLLVKINSETRPRHLNGIF